MKSTDMKIVEIAEAQGWGVSIIDGEYEFETYSPAGEDFIFSIPTNDDPSYVVGSIIDYADSFGVDEHVELWIGGRAQNGIPSSVRELVEDAEEIKSMLDDLAEAMRKLVHEEW